MDRYLELQELPKKLADAYKPGESAFSDLLKLCPKERDTIQIFGKETPLPRFQQNFGKNYGYNGSGGTVEEIPPEVKPLYDWAQKHETGPYNQMLINWYMNGRDYIGYHSDDESQIKRKSSILSVSLGETRSFKVKSKKKKWTKKYELNHGRVVIMKGQMQKKFKHSVPKVTGKRGANLGPRINLTFRKLKI
jgi:alkylated DNA repair dioxygenase AlkB